MPATHDAQLEAWLDFAERARATPDLPFDAHWRRYRELEQERPPALGPLPAWRPDRGSLRESNLARFMAERGVADYAALHRWSTADRASFWTTVVERLGIVLRRPPERVLDDAGGPAQPRWLPGAELNIADSCFAATDCTLAAVVGREGTERLSFVTVGELERLAGRVAAGLGRLGLAPGSRVALFMPMNLECVASYLGIVRAGAAVVSIADSFSAEELGRRLQIGGASLVVTVDRARRGGRELEVYSKVRAADAPRAVVVPLEAEAPHSLRSGDLLWQEFLGDEPTSESLAADPEAITNVLFSSGTTGEPKAIPWTHLTPIKCAMDGHFHHDIRPGDVVCWPTNVGWMMGPWLIYATLVNRACIALFDGAPTSAEFARFVERAGVTTLGVVPSLVRAWRESGAAEGADWRRVRLFSSTGEPSNREDYLWLMSRAGYRAPVIEYCGGTEIGGGYVTGSVLQPAAPAAFTTPALGLDLVILDDRGQPIADDGEGEVFLVPPSIGLSQRLLNRDHDEIYFADCPTAPDGRLLRRHGDQLARLPGGFYRAHGRADDTMNLGGVKVSSRELEVVLDLHPAVYEAAAVAVQPSGEGADRLVVFAVLRDAADPAELCAELQRLVSDHLNPLFRIFDLVVVEALPRTASNKLMRRELRARYLTAAP